MAKTTKHYENMENDMIIFHRFLLVEQGANGVKYSTCHKPYQTWQNHTIYQRFNCNYNDPPHQYISSC